MARSTSARHGKIQRRGRQRERQKNNRFYKQNNNFAHDITLFCIFLCPFLHDYDVKVPNFAFCGSHKQGTTKFYFSFRTWIWSLGIQFQEGSLTFGRQSKWVGIIAIKTERTQIHFLRDVLVEVALLDR